MGFTFTSKGDFENSRRWLSKLKLNTRYQILQRYASAGVSALSSATPVRTGKTASSWGYEIEHSSSQDTITFTNSNINDGCPIAIILQYGHGTRNGGYVQGRDYINPAIRPVFDNIANEVWKEVTTV